MKIQDKIYCDFIDAIQPAEELGGPELPEYIELMEKISAQALLRVDSALITAGQPRKWSVLLQYPGEESETYYAWVEAIHAESAVEAARKEMSDVNGWGDGGYIPVLLVLKGHIEAELREGDY